MRPTCLKGLEMNPSPGAGRARREGFKLCMKGDGDEMGLNEDEPRGAMSGLG